MSSPKLPAPIRGLLDERLRDADVRRLWQGLEARRIRRRHPTFRRAAWPLAFASALVGAALVFVLMRRAEPPVLHFANGRDVPQALQTSGSPVLFDDGSRIELGSSARLDLLESTPRTFAVALRTGEARFSVKPGGPRAWKIECGPVTVEVVGTQFTLTREDGRLRVSVEHGAVLVSGTPVPDHVVRLGASDTIVIPLSSPAEPVAGEADTELPAMVAEAPPAAPSAAVLVERPRAIPEAPSMACRRRRRARRGTIPGSRPDPRDRADDVQYGSERGSRGVFSRTPLPRLTRQSCPRRHAPRWRPRSWPARLAHARRLRAAGRSPRQVGEPGRRE